MGKKSLTEMKDHIMLCDVQYVRPDRIKGLKDYLYIIWRDLDTGKKELLSIEEPPMTIYFEKPEYRNHDYNKFFEYKEHLYPKTVKYNNIKKEIAKEAGGNWEKAYYNAFETKSYKELDKIHLYPYVFGSDFDINSWYRISWRLKLENSRRKYITKGFMDIEVDGLEIAGVPTDGSRPINAVTLIDDMDKTCYTFVYLFTPIPEYRDRFDPNPKLKDDEERKALYEKMWKQQEAFRDNIDGFVERLHNEFDELYGSDFNYKIYTYEDEVKMLVHLFQLINTLKLDMIGTWTSYDMDYIISRLKRLGLSPEEVICPKEFPNKRVNFVKDTGHYDIKNKLDYFEITSYSQYVDQMGIYAGIRKGESELRAFNLNYIAKKELKDEKYDYSEAGDIKTAPYNDWPTFIVYNIKDVLLQYGIENKVKDFDYVYTMIYFNATPFHRIFHRIATIRNQSYISFWNQGLIPGNNINKFNEAKYTAGVDEYGNNISTNNNDDEESFVGALVADPIFNAYVGRPLYGRPTNNIFRYVIDEDMGAFYPSINMAGNLNGCTLIFKLIIPPSEYRLTKQQKKDKETLYCEYHGITEELLLYNEDGEDVDDIARELMDNFLTRNYMSFGYKWLNMPDVEEVYEYIKNGD